jgi:hypothetical protein
MPEPAPNAQLLPSLGRLLRGLSALFWALPSALIICFYTAKTEGLRSFGIVPPLASTGWLAYGLWQLGAFQPQERIWRAALDRALILSLLNFGLSPFLFWQSRVPGNPFFLLMVTVLALCGLLFLASLNRVLQRLGAMLPDEGLRQEIRQFTPLNLNLLLTMLVLGTAYAAIHAVANLPPWMRAARQILDQSNLLWFLVPLVLLPLAMTMALLWKTKEVILESVFGPKP